MPTPFTSAGCSLQSKQEFLGSVASCLRPGGLFALIDVFKADGETAASWKARAKQHIDATMSDGKCRGQVKGCVSASFLNCLLPGSMCVPDATHTLPSVGCSGTLLCGSVMASPPVLLVTSLHLHACIPADKCTAEERATIWRHVSTYDNPEDVPTYKEMGAAAGFSRVECVHVGPANLYRLLALYK